MPPKLHFAFLGPHNSYLASVTNDVDESSKVEHHGLPTPWVKKYLKVAQNHYTSKIRGNDCFAFLGQQKNRDERICTGPYDKMLGEIEALISYAKEAHKDPDKLEPVFLSLGPNPGSFFAHIRSLGYYAWRNLPTELDNIIQRSVCRKKYGTIHDVAINAAGGWVIQFDEGKEYNMGGKLPAPLQNALSIGLAKKAQIRNLYLNHQNPDDYVLIFMDGNAYVGLHRDFHQKMGTLIEATFPPKTFAFILKHFSKSKKDKKAKINFTTSCACKPEEQDQKNAAYYNQRGRFHLSLNRPVHALSYLTEAYRLDVHNTIYKEDYFMARVAVAEAAQPFTPSAEDWMLHDDNVLRHENQFRHNKAQWLEESRRRHKRLIAQMEQHNLPSEWSYNEADPEPIGENGPIELPGPQLNVPHPIGPYELESVTAIILESQDAPQSRETT